MQGKAILARLGVAVLAAGAVAGCSGGGDERGSGADAAPASVDEARLAEEASTTVQALAGPLKQQLQAALAAGGPASAIQVCQQVAPALAHSVSQERGMQIRRVSLRYRNPQMGVPSDWQAAVLEDFDARRAAGEDPATLTWSAIEDGEYRFMQAIPTAPPCLACHGSELSAEVKAAIEERYPDDRATGYAVGDVRGAFVVTRTLR